MTPKKIKQLIILNAAIVVANIAIFSKAFLGLSFFKGSTLAMTVAWFTVIATGAIFIRRQFKTTQ